MFIIEVMHILEIPSFFPPYGGLFCLDQAKALAALGHEVRILSNVQLGVTIGWKDYLALPWQRYEHEMEGITVCQSYQRGIPKTIRYNVDRWVAIVRSMFQAYIAKYGRPDVIHAHCVKWAGYVAMRISEEYQIPYVVTEHLSLWDYAQEFGEPPSNAWQIPLLKEAYRHATQVITVSEELKRDLSCYFGTDYPSTTLSNIIDVDFYACKERQSTKGRKFRFCCSAIFVERKGYDVLFAAFRQLRQKEPHVELHVMGQGTDSRACKKLAGDTEGIIFHGHLDKYGVREVLYQSDAMVFATRSETQGLVLLEAQSTGVPIISTEAIPLSARMPLGAVYVAVDDAQGLADAMLREMKAERISAKKLHEQVEAKASPQIAGKQLESVLDLAWRMRVYKSS